DPRRPASAPRPAEHPFLCGPATAPALSFAVRRTGFSLGESLAYKFRLVSSVKKYSKPVSQPWEAARSSSGLGIKSLEDGADWPLPLYHKVNAPNDRDDS